MIEDASHIARVGLVVGGKWTLNRLLGVGGMAAVYAAQGPDGREVALKLLHAEMGLRRDVRERFLKEAYVSNQVTHPSVIRILEHGTDKIEGVEQAYLLMELLSGESLWQYSRRHGEVPLELLLDVLERVLEVLVIAHAAGIVHRDLKPENLFVTADGQIKVLDFGLVRTLLEVPGDVRTRTGLALGTLPYMAPEQALGRRDEIDGRVDLFALGATLFRLISGRRVHEADSEAELLMAMASKPAPSLASLAPNAPASLCAVIDLALAFSKEARYPSAALMLEDVRHLRRGQAPPYVSARRAERDQATRVQQVDERSTPPATSRAARTRLLGTVPPLSRGGTQPMEALPGEVDSPVYSPLAAVPVASPPALTTPERPPPVAAAFVSAAPQRDTWPAHVAPAKPRRRWLLGLLIALVLAAGATVAWRSFESTSTPSDPAPAPVVGVDGR